MPKVLISDNLSPRAVEIFRRRGVEADTRAGLKPGCKVNRPGFAGGCFA